jgi:N6-L-threonylcarbamoyladenine synthase
VQEAIVDVLVTKTFRAAERLGVRCLTVSGGVACNSRLQRRFELDCEFSKHKLLVAEKRFSTDNAAMIGILAERKLMNRLPPTDWNEEIKPGWALA